MSLTATPGVGPFQRRGTTGGPAGSVGGGSSGSWGDDAADPGAGPPFTSGASPIEALTAPVAAQHEPDLVESFCNLMDLFSLGSWARKRCDTRAPGRVSLGETTAGVAYGEIKVCHRRGDARPDHR
jgi:hypothetical protein